MTQANVLQRVTDKFNIFKDGRRLSANKRHYILNAVKSMFETPETQELLRLGEAFGYYGHQNRKRANKLDIDETEVIMIDGKPVVVENVPACRTIDINIDDDGTVTHTQELFDTVTGHIVQGMINSHAGGWSWATGGSDTPEASITRSYHGMDYVKRPNYLSLNHPAMMLESVGDRNDMILESLNSQGFSQDDAILVLNYWDKNNTSNALTMQLENENMMLEGLLYEQRNKYEQLEQQIAYMDTRNELLLDAMSSLPIFISDEQKKSLLSMKTPHDKEVVKAMFESVGSKKLETLPIGNYKHQGAQNSVKGKTDRNNCIVIGSTTGRTFS